MNSEVALCPWEGAQYLFFNEGIPAFVYYSHIPVFIAAAFLALFILYRARGSLAANVLAFTIVPFALWVFFDQIFWASNRSDVIMFVWSAIVLIEPLIHGGIFYLQYVLIWKKDLPLKFKLLAGALLAPLIVFVPTSYTLSAFDVGTCLAVESFFGLYYSYAVELVFIALIIGTGIAGYWKTKEHKRRLEITYITIGILAFLLLFTAGNLLGSFTSNWQIGQLGLLGMPIFLGLLTYTIVRFHTFRIQIASTQALVVAVWFLLLATLFVQSEGNIQLINAATLILFTVLGYQLVRSVKREIEQREEIEDLAHNLERANTRLRELDKMKTEFVSIASHQLRSPLYGIRGYADVLLDGTIGPISDKVRDAIENIHSATLLMLKSVEDFLNVTRIEQGRMQYSMEIFDICEMVREVLKSQKEFIKNSHLDLTTNLEGQAACDVYADVGKLKQVAMNLIDNAVKYTKEGAIDVSCERDGNVMRITVKDTGIGLNEESKRKLFGKFSRAPQARKINASGTGLGLYVAKQMVEAHHGKIWAESEGEGKGSTFTIEIPVRSVASEKP